MEAGESIKSVSSVTNTKTAKSAKNAKNARKSVKSTATEAEDAEPRLEVIVAPHTSQSVLDCWRRLGASILQVQLTMSRVTCHDECHTCAVGRGHQPGGEGRAGVGPRVRV